MSLVKRGKTWHTHFFVDGQRFRQSLDTTDYREALRSEKKLIGEARAGKLSAKRNESARLPFSAAAERFLQDRTPHLAPKSVTTERERAKAVNRTFGDTPVFRVTPESVLAYVRGRKAAGIANATVNRELDVIRGVLKKAKRWHLFADEIRPLPVRQNIGRALAYDEKLRLLKIAASRPEWQTAAWAATLALNTTMRGCEIKQLCWRDVDLMEKTLTIRKSKTEAGERVIPLNGDAWNAIVSLYRRSRAFGDVRPEHYVFAACEHGSKPKSQSDLGKSAMYFDPTRPQRSWRSAWRYMTAAVQCPACGKLQRPAEVCVNPECKAGMKDVKSPLAGLRFHDLRHHAITELAESQASDGTIMAIAGHVSPKMLQHYSHIRIQAKRTALDSISTRRADSVNLEGLEGGYDTNNDTKPRNEAEGFTQVVENMVDLSGIEPLASSLRTRRSPS
jgi:integrase